MQYIRGMIQASLIPSDFIQKVQNLFLSSITVSTI